MLLPPSVINVALAVNMPDAPMTQDTVTASKDGDDNDDNDEGNDQPDGLPDPEDTPINTETINSGNNDGSKEDKVDEGNNDKVDGTNLENDTNEAASSMSNCPAGQERALFDAACEHTFQKNDCGNYAALLNPSSGNACLNR